MGTDLRIGFVGQGYIGKNYADDFERRGFRTVRYALEKPYRNNKDKIRGCDIVFIAVPTPTTPKGFDDSIVRGALSLVGKGKTAVIKSTILPGTTRSIQEQYPDRTTFYSPEFLSEKTATRDATHPFSNIIGLSRIDARSKKVAKSVLAVLPKAPFSLICSSTEAELIKYAHNLNGYFQILLSNILYDAASALGSRWEHIEAALRADTMITNRYIKPVHASGHTTKAGRGAGGHCFIKDFAAFRGLFGSLLPEDKRGLAVLSALERKNIELLKKSGKDLDLLKGVYGTSV